MSGTQRRPPDSVYIASRALSFDYGCVQNGKSSQTLVTEETKKRTFTRALHGTLKVTMFMAQPRYAQQVASCDVAY